MGPRNRTTIRGTSPSERGVTRAASSPDPDRGVDLGGVWDEHGNYWYADDDGTTWVWSEAEQQWRMLASPSHAVQLRGEAPLSEADKAYFASQQAAYKRHLGAPGRQFGQTLFGGPPRIVGKMAAEAITNEYVDLGALDQTGILTNLSDQFKEAEADLSAQYVQQDAEAEARVAHERGELFQVPVAVASNKVLEEELKAEHGTAVAAGTTKRVGSPVRSPARVEGFIGDVARVYREELVAAKKAEPNATASRHGTLAEQRTLKKVPELARARKLNPGHIQVGNFRVGVTGPRGGQLSAEMGSPHYGFMIELKKSPKAVRGWQAQGHLIAVDYSLDFKWGGVYVRIYGENYKPGAGVDRRAMGGKLKRKPKRTRRPRPRLR